MEQLKILTEDGECPAHVCVPAGKGPWPAVIIYMDAPGVRPTLLNMGEHLSRMGFVVLIPDLYYRYGPYEPLNIPEIVASGKLREAVAPLRATTSEQHAAEDTGAFLAYLDSRNDVAGGKVGVIGYCMGGGMALTAAARYPDRIAAVASFHGGGLATDLPTSPHLLASKIKARVYVAGADQDATYPVDMAERLDKALTDAGVEHRCEIYDGAAHGWTMADLPAFNAAAAERAWGEVAALFRGLPAG